MADPTQAIIAADLGNIGAFMFSDYGVLPAYYCEHYGAHVCLL